MMQDPQQDRENRPGGPNRQGPPMRISRGIFGWIAFIFCALLLVTMVMQGWPRAETISYDKFLQEMKDNNIARIEIQEDRAIGELKQTPSLDQNKRFQVELPQASDGVLRRQIGDEVHQNCPNAKI